MNDQPRRGPTPRVLQVTTADVSFVITRGRRAYLREAGFDVMVVSSPGEELERTAREEGVRGIEVKMEREISLVQDVKSLWRLYRVMRQVHPDLTDVGTPKAGLLGGLTAWLSGVPCRIYTLYGLRCETTTGLNRRLLLFAERVACYCAHQVICVSESLRQKAVSLGIVELERTTVLGSGSCNGIDAEAFGPTAKRVQTALAWRAEKGIPKNAPIVGFVGRFVVDKGIAELFEAYSRLRHNFPELRLLLVGDFEEGDPVPQPLRERIKSDPHVTITGFLRNVEPYYHVMDVLALPTYREGFPTVVLEAQAAGKPAVVTNATGAVDSVCDGVTGLIVPVGDSVALTGALAKLLAEPKLAVAMGQNGRKRAIAEFRPTRIWNELVRQYQSALEAKGLPLPVASRNSCINTVPERINT